ncbi:transglycosylase domain-containing protein [Nocardia bovistercoris]|uniref:transglycosylase domain-containing protein n=1 Tax=Nocardia bovistercoris TaxID=2785916 RepID=UPI0038CD5FD2
MRSFGKRREVEDKPETAPYASIAGWKTRAPESTDPPEANAAAPRTRKRGNGSARSAEPPPVRLGPETESQRLERKRRTRGQRLRRLILALFILFVALPSLLFVLVYWSAEIPDPAAVRTNQIATVLASDGATVLTKIVPPEGNRTPVPLSDVPPPVRDAVLSAEDRDFYTNPGYSKSGFLRAARDNLLGRDDAGGGSTITQQYVKNAFLGSERTVTRKMRELIIAAKMARQWSKEDILAAYLNTVYYGRGAYGIAAASDSYFGKPPAELSLAEGAVLAALLRTPSLLDPETHLPELKTRWQYVLDGMVEMGALAPGNRDATVFPDIVPITEVTASDDARGPEGLIRTQVLRELRASGISDQDLKTGALRITTTIDTRAQQAALDAVTGRLGNQPAELRAAVVSVDPRSGAVRAYYGGGDGLGYDFAQAPLQTGSAFKVFAAVAAQQQFIPLSRVIDSAPVTDRGTTITNVDGESCGRCPLSEALKRSLNTSFYRLTMTMSDGPRAVADAAHLAGIPEQIPGVAGESLTEDGGPPLNGIVLGQYLVRPIDMASAYATLANSGVYRQPYFVQRVVTGDGRVLLDRGGDDPVGRQLPHGQQRISRTIAENTVAAMLPIAAYSNGHALADGRPSGAKTGTTQLGTTDLNKDAWMIGFTPSLSTAVWVGTERSQPIRTGRGGDIYGSGLPSDIWKQVMDDALSGTPIEQFPTGGSAAGGTGPGIGPGGANPPTSTTRAPSGGPYDILNPPRSSAAAPPPVSTPSPTPSRGGEIFPGLNIPPTR